MAVSSRHEILPAVTRALLIGFLGASVLLAETPPILEAGVRVERVLSPGDTHVFSMPLVSGQFYRVTVIQNHLDAVVRILSADGVVMGEADNSADVSDPISLYFAASREETCRVEIRLRKESSAPGPYALMAESRAASPDDNKRVDAERVRAEADHILLRASAAASKEAAELYAKSIAGWHELGDPREEAATLSRLTHVLFIQGESRGALARAEESLSLWRLVGDERGAAVALDQGGLALTKLGDPRRALESLEQALELRRTSSDLRGQAETLNNMAVAFGNLGDLPKAIEKFTDALRLMVAFGDRLGEALILKNRASARVALGEAERGRADLDDALNRFRAMGNRREEGVTLLSIGNIDLDRNDARAALRHFGLALVLLREAGDKHFEGFTRNHMGLAELASRRPDLALKEFDLAQELFHACDDRRGEAMATANMGRALLVKGDVAEARDRLGRAVPQLHALGDRAHEAAALVDLARAGRALGDLAVSRKLLEEALHLTESLRELIPGSGERASFMARTRDRYDLLIGVLMDLHAKDPGRGWDAEALSASERAKARSLLELLAEARIDLRAGVDERLLEEERSLETRIEARRRQDERRLLGTPEAKSSDPGERSLDALLADYQDLEGRLREASPRYSALARPHPLSVHEIREQVLDGDTLLLEYALGEERSFVWAVTKGTLTSHALPGRSVVEAAARRLYQAWSANDPAGEREADRRARALSRMVLGPVADQLGARRLAIVAEGMLQYLPFGALPAPNSVGASVPLVATQEVITLPSATTLAVLRREVSGRSAPGERVAVLADPVFDRRDPRVLTGSRSGGSARNDVVDDALTRSMKETGALKLERLPASRREARAIAGLAGARKSFVALDFEASRANALGAEVSNARIVHFASHGLLNSRHPELSGIVLSLVDEHGDPTDGFLQTRDIYKLKLSADLVVLSACQTALGKDVRGEGLIGLSRGFMYAGAPRIVVSLWPVPDRASFELMRHFYEGVLKKGLRPAAALRAATIFGR